MRKTFKCWLWVAPVVILGVVVTLFFMLKERLHRETYAFLDTEQMGKVLYLFVEDEARMPADQSELRAKGYIETREDGYSYPGKGIIGRRTPYSSGPIDMPFLYLTDVKVRYGSMWHGGKIIEGPRGSGYIGQRYSALIALLLEEKMGHTATSTSPSTQAK